MLRILFVLACALAAPAFAQGGAQQAVPWRTDAAEGWSLAWPSEQPKVSFQGVANFDKAGVAQGSMLYYGGAGVAGLVAQVLTHAALTESAKSSQKNAIQAEADKVLSDYRTALDAFTPEELIQRTSAQLRATASALRDAASARWSLEVQPLFRMTQDRRALLVDSVVSVRASSSADVVRRSAVRVVAAPLVADGVAERWSVNDGEALKAESARLLAQAIELSLSDLAGQWDDGAAPQRTIRYDEGGEERIERAQVLQQVCGRAVVRTLRGDLMNVPLRNADMTGCAAAGEAASVAAPASAPAQ